MLKAKKILQIIFAAGCLACFGWSASAANPSGFHQFHTTLTRIDYNARENLFEISIQLFKHDLKPLLERKYKTRVDFGKTKDIDKLILNYLSEEFVLTDKQGDAKHLKWIGSESDVDSIWVYLETESAESPEGYDLRNTIFFESFPEQTNLVICRFEAKKADLTFKVGDKVKKITGEK